MRSPTYGTLVASMSTLSTGSPPRSRPHNRASPSGPLPMVRLTLQRERAPFHFHPEFELTHIKKGEGQRYVGTQVEDFEADDLIFLPNPERGQGCVPPFRLPPTRMTGTTRCRSAPPRRGIRREAYPHITRRRPCPGEGRPSVAASGYPGVRGYCRGGQRAGGHSAQRAAPSRCRPHGHRHAGTERSRRRSPPRGYRRLIPPMQPHLDRKS